MIIQVYTLDKPACSLQRDIALTLVLRICCVCSHIDFFFFFLFDPAIGNNGGEVSGFRRNGFVILNSFVYFHFLSAWVISYSLC